MDQGGFFFNNTMISLKFIAHTNALYEWNRIVFSHSYLIATFIAK